VLHLLSQKHEPERRKGIRTPGLPFKLESAVIVELEKNSWSRMANRLMLALALLFGALTGSGLIVLVPRVLAH